MLRLVYSPRSTVLHDETTFYIFLPDSDCAAPLQYPSPLCRPGFPSCNLCRLFASLLCCVASPDWLATTCCVAPEPATLITLPPPSDLLCPPPVLTMPEKKKVSEADDSPLLPSLSGSCHCTFISEETDHHLHHLLRPLLLPPPLRGRGLLLLPGLLQAGHREVLLLCRGNGRLQH